MEPQLEKLANAALKRELSERAAFAQLLLASLGQDAEVEHARALAVERRIALLESGTTAVISMEMFLPKCALC